MMLGIEKQKLWELQLKLGSVNQRIMILILSLSAHIRITQLVKHQFGFIYLHDGLLHCSDTFPGTISDKDITEQCEVLDKVNKGKVVLLIKDLISQTCVTKRESYTIAHLQPYSDPAFIDLLGRGGLQKPPYVTLKPLTLLPPSLHRIVYALILTSTDTVMSLWREMTSLWHHLFLNVSLRSSKAINLLNTVPEGVKILFWGIKGHQ